MHIHYVVVILCLSRMFKEICAESVSNDIEFNTDGSWHPINTKEGQLGGGKVSWEAEGPIQRKMGRSKPDQSIVVVCETS